MYIKFVAGDLIFPYYAHTLVDHSTAMRSYLDGIRPDAAAPFDIQRVHARYVLLHLLM